jgi:trehalose-phosphatase
VEHLFRNWRNIERLLKARKLVFLLLDYDGTLTPIVSRPELARVSLKTKKLLKDLSANESFKIAIISGRPLREIKRLVGLKSVIYAGNHGLELEGPDIKLINRGAALKKRLMANISKSLKRAISGLKGAFVENKGLTLSVHFRLMHKRHLGKLKFILSRTLRPWKAKRAFRITGGKMVYEIRPSVNWNKGKAAKWILHHYRTKRAKTLTICIGDDRTDEDMFKALGKRAINVSVGKPDESSSAGYYLKNTEEVKRFLSRLANLKK